MYMSLPQLEQLLKDRRESVLNSARSAENRAKRKWSVTRGRRVRIPVG